MKKTIQLLLWILVLQLMGYGMGMVTEPNLDPWYLSLYKSAFTPPGYVFGIVWSILYVMLALVGWQLYLGGKPEKITRLKFAFVVQLVLNWLWTPLFFHLHLSGAALICLMAIVLFTTGFLISAWQQFRLLFWLMLPYWLWVCFASYLNFVIWHGN